MGGSRADRFSHHGHGRWQGGQRYQLGVCQARVRAHWRRPNPASAPRDSERLRTPHIGMGAEAAYGSAGRHGNKMELGVKELVADDKRGSTRYGLDRPH